MYTRHVRIQLKSGNLPEFKHLLKDKIIPLLRAQRGFQDAITFVTAKRNQVIAISFWDDQRSADDYNHIAYLDVLRVLSSVVERLPVVETFEDMESTLHPPAALPACASDFDVAWQSG